MARINATGRNRHVRHIRLDHAMLACPAFRALSGGAVKVLLHMATPDLHQALTDYAALYAATYGRDEPLAALLPAMLTAFLASDRNFAQVRARRGQVETIDGQGR